MNLVKSICKFHYDQNPYHLNNRVHENDHINSQSPHWYSVTQEIHQYMHRRAHHLGIFNGGRINCYTNIFLHSPFFLCSTHGSL